MKSPTTTPSLDKVAESPKRKLGMSVVIELWQYGGLPEILFDLTSKVLYRMPRPVEIVLRPFHSAGIAISRFKMFRELGDRSKKAFPSGYILIAQKCT
jgi:hypothetical protein